VDLSTVEAAEKHALDQARAAFETNPYDIACFIAEPIQGEGGDNHMRAEFLQAMQQLCHEYGALFILDEVQTGVGLTGTAWAYQQLGLEPDIVAFSKKAQVGGIMAGRRVDEVAENVFAVSGRINSTWGGGLVDMVRSRRYLEIIERDGVIEHAAEVGAWFLAELRALATRHSGQVSNVRGRGLMVAFDLPDTAVRDELLALSSGTRAIRFRPALNVTREELSIALGALDRTLAA
jgi:L-lysine 6-transaminase